jgi:hypothetical protein
VAITHPLTNGKVERTNGMILQGLKPRILTLEGRDVFAQLNTSREVGRRGPLGTLEPANNAQPFD